MSLRILSLIHIFPYFLYFGHFIINEEKEINFTIFKILIFVR